MPGRYTLIVADAICRWRCAESWYSRAACACDLPASTSRMTLSLNSRVNMRRLVADFSDMLSSFPLQGCMLTFCVSQGCSSMTHYESLSGWEGWFTPALSLARTLRIFCYPKTMKKISSSTIFSHSQLFSFALPMFTLKCGRRNWIKQFAFIKQRHGVVVAGTENHLRNRRINRRNIVAT